MSEVDPRLNQHLIEKIDVLFAGTEYVDGPNDFENTSSPDVEDPTGFLKRASKACFCVA